MRFGSVNDLLRDLKALGVTNARCDRPPSLMSQARLQALQSHYHERWQQQDGRIPANFEIIYGHAWMSDYPDTASLDARGEAVYQCHH